MILFGRAELPFFRSFDRERVELFIAAGADESRIDLALGRDEKIDHGDVVAQRQVRILPNDTPESLHARIQVAEHELYPAAINEVCRQLSE